MGGQSGFSNSGCNHSCGHYSVYTIRTTVVVLTTTVVMTTTGPQLWLIPQLWLMTTTVVMTVRTTIVVIIGTYPSLRCMCTSYTDIHSLII